MSAKTSFRRSYTPDCVLVMGSESRGLSGVVSGACKHLVTIPMKQGVESLNVATAAALVVYEACRRLP